MADVERTKAELLSIFADAQVPASIDPQDMRDYVVTTDIVNTRFSTGLITGGNITINALDDATIDIAAGEAFFADNFTDPQNPVRIKVSWPTFFAETMVNLTLAPLTFFGLDVSSGTAVVAKRNGFFTAPERRDIILLAGVVHSSGVRVDDIGGIYVWSMDLQQTVHDVGEAVGQVNMVGGNIYSGKSSLSLKKTSGSTFFIGVNYQLSKKAPNTTVDPNLDPIPAIIYTYQNGSGGFVAAPISNVVDPNFWDDGTGILDSVQPNQFTIQRIFWFPSVFLTVIHYGQTEYGTIAAALAAINTEEFVRNPILINGFRAWLIVKRGTTDLTVPADAKFLSASKFGDILRPD